MRTILVLTCFYLCSFWPTAELFAQEDVLQHLLAPGEFSTFHKPISGIKNCSKCHSLGKGVSSDKCLDCHKTVGTRLAQKIGFHGKIQGDCIDCHKEHGKQPIEFVPESFDHQQTIFPLEGSHKKTPCEKCHLKTHKPTGKLRFTYLDLPTDCQGCHTNPHEKRFFDCRECHSANLWQHTFDHNKKSAFKLVGLHQQVVCNKCHPGFQDIGRKNLFFSVDTAKNCLSCHKDEHQGGLSPDCQSCHSMRGWTPTQFDHDKTKFKLSGPHQKLSCKACHLDRKFTGLPVDCGGCHKKSPHNAKHTPCSNCHSQNNWHQLRNDWQNQRDMHAFFRYPLLGAHLKIECQKCHTSEAGTPIYFNMAFADCRDCHKDKHENQLSPPCSRCHTVDSFKNIALFDHQQARFKLGELHKSVPCEKCHPKNIYTNTPTSCFRCHLDVARFSRGFYKQTTMNLISPKAKIVTCTGCHETTVPNHKVSEITCIKCHEDAYRLYFLQWRQQFSNQINAAETDIQGLKNCKATHELEVLKETEDAILFLKRDFEHNYRFAAALMRISQQELLKIRHEYCQD